jgi:hypothetical protein
MDKFLGWSACFQENMIGSPDPTKCERNKTIMDKFLGWSACFQENMIGALEQFLFELNCA